MDLLSAILSVAATPFLAILSAFFYVILKSYAGKSRQNSEYAPVDGTVFHQLFYFSSLYDHQTEVAKKHKTFRLLGPENSELYTTDTRNIEHVLKTNFHKYSIGKYNQEIVTDLFGEGIFTVDGDKWRQQRKLVSVEFSTRILRDFSCSVFRDNAAKLVKVISSNITVSHQVFDMQDTLMRCTLDSIFKVGFGVELNCLMGTTREGTAFMKAFDESNALVYWRYVDPFWKLKRVFNVGCEASLGKNIKIIDDFVTNLIRNRRTLLEEQQIRVKEDILSRFMMESEKDPERMNDKYLRDIILNFMVAGKDTTANTLSWFFYMICKNPLIQEKLAQEVRHVTGTRNDDSIQIEEFMAKVTDATLDQMHYLHATLTETLRLYPAVPVDGRCADEDDILPDGFRMNKGDGLYYMAYAMGRMTYIWGEDAEDFRPERWLNNGVFQPESPFKFVSFHAGPRTCLGKDFAYRQMKIVSSALLRFFRFRLADDTRKVTYRTMFTLHIDGGLYLRAIPWTSL